MPPVELTAVPVTQTLVPKQSTRAPIESTQAPALLDEPSVEPSVPFKPTPALVECTSVPGWTTEASLLFAQSLLTQQMVPDVLTTATSSPSSSPLSSSTELHGTSSPFKWEIPGNGGALDLPVQNELSDIWQTLQNGMLEYWLR